MKKFVAFITIVVLGLFYAEKKGLLPNSLSSLLSQIGSYQEVNITQIYDNTDMFHKKNVSVKGYISDYQERVSKRGNRYTVFQLYNDYGSMTVHYQGHMGLSSGLRVCLKGEFLKEKRVRNLRFYNQIEADSATILN